MLVHKFPDLNWVRSLRNDAVKPVNTWKNIALNIKCKEVCRTGVESPYSLFMNVKGFSHCKVNGKQYLVDNSTFLLSQPGEVYDLVVDNMQQTEIFNIHINRDFFIHCAYAITASHQQQLDNPHPPGEVSAPLFSQLYPKDEQFKAIIANLKTAGEQGDDAFNLALPQLVSYLLMANDGVRRKVAELPIASTAVQKDIYYRLSRAKDFIYSNYSRTIDLDELCREIAMSKFHFLRLFKACYGTTPHQYITGVRMEKARDLLRSDKASITEISDHLGFEYPNSFIKVFRKSYGIAPLQFRKGQNSNFG